jgi:hypothetical protein
VVNPFSKDIITFIDSMNPLPDGAEMAVMWCGVTPASVPSAWSVSSAISAVLKV